MDLFDVILAKKMSGGSGGGGGSSDFSTAEVTFVNSATDAEPYTVIVPHIYYAETGNDHLAIEGVDIPAGQPATLTIPLYKGKIQGFIDFFFLPDSLDWSVLPSFAEGASIDQETGLVTITGDGSITAAGNPTGGGGGPK